MARAHKSTEQGCVEWRCDCSQLLASLHQCKQLHWARVLGDHLPDLGWKHGGCRCKCMCVSFAVCECANCINKLVACAPHGWLGQGILWVPGSTDQFRVSIARPAGSCNRDQAYLSCKQPQPWSLLQPPAGLQISRVRVFFLWHCYMLCVVAAFYSFLYLLHGTNHIHDLIRGHYALAVLGKLEQSAAHALRHSDHCAAPSIVAGRLTLTARASQYLHETRRQVRVALVHQLQCLPVGCGASNRRVLELFRHLVCQFRPLDCQD